jgi:V/A-type H+-transporting ATPase subunit E
MIGAERITAKIISDAENDAREKLAAAGAEREKLREDYKRRAKELRAKMLADAEADAEGFVARAKSSAALEKRNAVLNAKSEMVDAAFDAALAEIRAMDAEKYRDLLVGFIESAIVAQINAEAEEIRNYGADELSVADKYEIVLNRRDREAHGAAVIDGIRRSSIGRLSSEQVEKIVLSDKTADIDGGVMIRYGDMEINCSLSMIFARLREELESDVFNILFNQN